MLTPRRFSQAPQTEPIVTTAIHAASTHRVR